MLSNFARAAFTLVMCLLAAGRLPAQDAVLSEFYGTGVHHYFSGNASQAMSDLTASINGGSKDPRAYYFRGLAELRLGWQQNALADFQKGAALESADINQFYPVGKSLERVQGSARMSLERYRAIARAEAHERQQRRDAVRYEQRKRAEAQVLRGPGPSPARVVPPPPKPGMAAVEEAAAEDPFAENDKAENAETMPDEDKPAAGATDDNPFAEPAADDAAAEEKPEADESMPAEDAAPEDGAPDDKAADDKAGEENPFGDDTSGK